VPRICALFQTQFSITQKKIKKYAPAFIHFQNEGVFMYEKEK